MFEGDLGAALLASAERHADRPALWAAGERLTYAELFDAAANVASEIRAAGIPTGERVAILSQRTRTAYAGVIGALLAGCAYVPLNTQFPRERNGAMLRASGAAALVLDRPSAAGLDNLLGPLEPGLLVVEPEDDGLPGTEGRATEPRGKARSGSAGSTRRAADRDQPAYLLFTSGTTGTPKGVPISHANVDAYLSGLSAVASIGPEDRVLQCVDLTFDLSVHDMFLAWLNGAELYSIPENAVLLTSRFIAQNGITACLIVPGTGAYALEKRLAKPGSMPSLRLSCFCGEALPATVAAGWKEAAPNSRVINLYGPTEATVAFSFYEFDPEAGAEFSVVPIGRPLGAQGMGLFTPEMTAATPGEPGEICLSGSQVAAGYWRDPAIDAEKFAVADGTRWYKTGDLGRWNERHGMIFAGRADRQVKIRGYRVELQEIEGVVRRVTGRQQVAVVAWPVTPDGLAQGSVAFVCGEEMDAGPIRAGCRAVVADYMIPDRILFVPELPVNANGKVDYKVLAQHPSLSA
jgi:amino acid adenylation domain-containing protein